MIVTVVVPVRPVESWASTLEMYDPRLEAVPLIVPEALRLTPGGSDPPIFAKVTGGVPLVTEPDMDRVNCCPICTFVSVG